MFPLLGEHQVIAIEPVLHVVEVRVPLAVVLVQHEDADVPVGIAAPSSVCTTPSAPPPVEYSSG